MDQNGIDMICESRLVSNTGKQRSLVQGVGVNDLPHIIKIEVGGKQKMHAGYQQWHNMLTRAYRAKYREKKPTYKDVTVCDEWLKASNFVEWYKQQKKEQGWQLDKDILFVGSKTYNPENCIFIPQWLNTFTIDSGNARGEYLIGVCWHKHASKFMAQCSNPITGVRGHLGYYHDELEAHQAWKSRKLELALELKPQMDDIDTRIYPNVVKIIEAAK